MLHVLIVLQYGGAMKILSVYDGTIHSKNALQYGMQKIKKQGGELVVLHVFQSNLFLDYDGGPGAEEIARRESQRHLAEATALISEQANSLSVRLITEDGEPESEILRLVGSEHPDLLLVPPRFKAITKRVPCPVCLIPGTILVPVDDSDGILASLDQVVSEVRAMDSKVLLLGIVPIHLFSYSEKEELKSVEKKTVGSVKKVKKLLAEQGIATTELIRSGYPDEEILKAADEFRVSLIMLPGGGKTPSELNKAAAIIIGAQENAENKMYLLPVATIA